MASANALLPENLSRLVGTPNCPVLIDVCLPEDFALDPRLIPTARRVPFESIEQQADSLAEKACVIICQKGLKLSQGGAALLRTHGIDARFLEGGAVEWASRGLPMVPAKNLPKPRSDGASLWVTSHHHNVGRIACPWLIRRFIDPFARFLFVAPAQVLNVAEKYGATAFDVTEVSFTHAGDKCTFDAMLSHFQLHLPALNKMATIIRAADTGQGVQSPEAPGLRTLSLGLSHMTDNDLTRLEMGITFFDALYRWARDAQEEGPDRPEGLA